MFSAKPLLEMIVPSLINVPELMSMPAASLPPEIKPVLRLVRKPPDIVTASPWEGAPTMALPAPAVIAPALVSVPPVMTTPAPPASDAVFWP